MLLLGHRAPVRASGVRAALLIGTAMGTIAPATAQNIASSGTTDCSLTRSERIDGGPRTVDIATSGGNITLDLGEVTAVNNSGTLGAAIAADNSGPGSVSVRTTSALSSGSSASYAVSTRTTSGANTVNAARAQDGSGNGIGIWAVSTTGAIAVTSGDASGRTGIFAVSSGADGAAAGSVAVTSTTAAAGFLGPQGDGSKVAIQAQGGTVTVDSGLATVRTPGFGGGIVASSTDGTVVRATETRVEGDNGVGIRAASNKTVSVTSGTLSTSGTNAIGIHALADTGTTIVSGTITTTGTGAHGIRVLPSATGQSGTAPAINVTSDTITANGNGASGILITPGLVTPGAGTTTVRSNAVTALGTGSGAIQVSGGTGGINVTSGTVTAGARTGIVAVTQGGSAVTVTSTDVRSGLSGIIANGRNRATIASGTVAIDNSRAGTFGTALAATGRAVTVTSGTIAATGVGATAGISVSQIAGASADNALTVTSGSIDANGDGGFGIQAIALTGPVAVTSTGRITTNGGVGFINNDLSRPRFANGISVVSAAGAVTVDSNDVATSALLTHGIRVESGRGIQSFALPEGTVRGAGAITLTSRGTVATTGEEAAGIVVLAGDSAAAIDNLGAIRTTGRGANGIYAAFGTGALTINSKDIDASGEFAGGIVVDQSSEDGNAPGSVKMTLTGTTRANGDAVEVEMNAGSLDITNSGAIIGSGAVDGVEAAGIDVEGQIAVSIASTGSIATTTGIGINIEDAASATVRSNAITGQNGRIGIFARVSGAVDVTSNTVSGYSNGINLAGTTARLGSTQVDTIGGIAIGIFAADGAAVVASDRINLVGRSNGSDGIGIVANGTSVTIDSGSITASGPGNHAGIRVGDGTPARTVNVSSRDITTSGDGGYAIATTGGAGGTTITSLGTITTTGGSRAPAPGVEVRQSYGIRAASTGGPITIASNTISTAGDDAGAIVVESRRGTNADGSLAAAQPIAVTSTGAISTLGADARGIAIDADGGDTRVVNAGTITTAGDFADGMRIFGAGATSVDNGGTIATGGRFTTGIAVSDAASATIRSNAVTAQGSGSTAIDVTVAGAIDIASTRVAAAAGGIVTLGGATRIDSTLVETGLRGIEVTAENATATVKSGTITLAAAADAAGTSGALLVRAGDTIVVDSGTIVTSGGGNRYGINAATIGDAPTTGGITITSGSISTVGNGGYGMFASAVTGPITIASTGTVATTGGTRVTGTGEPRYSNGIWALAGSGAVSITSNAISTLGDGASGIAVEAGSGVTSLRDFGATATAAASVTSTGAITTQGADAWGISVQSGGGATDVANAGTIATAGDRAFGIRVAARDGGATTIVSNAVATSGADAFGIAAVADTGAIAVSATRTATTGAGAHAIAAGTLGAIRIDAGTATAADGSAILAAAGDVVTVRAAGASGAGDGHSGVAVLGGKGVVLDIAAASSTGAAVTGIDGIVLRGDAIFAEAAAGTIDATVGSARANGLGADAVRLIANGEGGAVTARITGAVAADSGYGLFIDPPGTATVTVAAGASVAGGLGGISTVAGRNVITNAGTIAATNGAAIAAAGATRLDNAGTLTGSNGVAVGLDATDDLVTLRTGSIVNGTIAGGGGTDAAVLIGTGTLASASQTVAGLIDFDSLTVESGYWTAPATGSTGAARTAIARDASLEVQNGATGLAGFATGGIVNDGTLVVRSAADTAGDPFAGLAVTGSGGITFTGAGTATLAGADTLANTGLNRVTGGTLVVTGTQDGAFATVAGGTLRIGEGGDLTGTLVNDGALVVDKAADAAYTGALGGAGTFTKEGAGLLVFGSGYSFTGTTSLNGGAIRFSAPVAAATELDVRGSGTIDLSGQANTIAELKGDSAAAIVNIAGGSLTVNQSTATTFAGVLAGNGSLTKSGIGRLDLTGTSTYTGPTIVSGGTLAVNGRIASPVTVAAGGTLGGAGTVGSVTVASGGTYAPGNSIGTQTVAGSLAFAAGSIFQVEVNVAGAADRVDASGTATLAGGTVQVLAEAGSYARRTDYTILTAAGGVSGRFAGVTSNFAFLTPLLSYDANAVRLSLARNDVAFGALAGDRNQAAVANAIFARGAGNTLFDTILFESVERAPAIFTELAGEFNAALTTELADSTRRVRHAVLDRGAVTGGDGVALWAQGLQTSARSNGGDATARLRASRTGIVGGLDYTVSGVRITGFGGWQDSDVALRGRGANADVKTTFAGASAAWTGGPLTIQGGGLLAWHDVETRRSLPTSGFGTATARPDADGAELFADVAYTLTQGPVTVAPFVRHAYVRTRIDAYAETGSTAALSVAQGARDIGILAAGIRVGGAVPLGSATIAPRLSLAYEHAYGDDLDGTAVQRIGGGGPAFTVTGAGYGKSGVTADAGLDLQLGRFSVGMGGFGATSGRWSDYGGRAQLGYRF